MVREHTLELWRGAMNDRRTPGVIEPQLPLEKWIFKKSSHQINEMLSTPNYLLSDGAPLRTWTASPASPAIPEEQLY